MKQKYDIWRSVVKEIRLLNTAPGYEYIYFNNEREADEYFTELCGKGWRDLPWARFYLRRSEESEIAKKHRRQTYRPVVDDDNPAVIINAEVVDPNNYFYLVKQLVRKGRSAGEIAKYLIERGYSVDHKKLERVVKQYTTKPRYDKDTLAELVKSYGDISLREIAKRLRDDNIHVSYEYIRRILKK